MPEQQHCVVAMPTSLTLLCCHSNNTGPLWQSRCVAVVTTFFFVLVTTNIIETCNEWTDFGENNRFSGYYNSSKSIGIIMKCPILLSPQYANALGQCVLYTLSWFNNNNNNANSLMRGLYWTLYHTVYDLKLGRIMLILTRNIPIIFAMCGLTYYLFLS